MVQEVTPKPDLPAPIERQIHRPPQAAAKSPQPHASVTQSEPPAVIKQDDVALVIQQASKELQKASPQLQMEVDSDLGRVIVKITDGQTGQVIRQIPAQELVDLAKQLKGLHGLLIEKHA